MERLPPKLQSKLTERSANNSMRYFPTTNNLVDFSSNDYLGFSRTKSIQDGVLKLLKEKQIYLNGATGSRLLTGNHELYPQLESLLADYHKADAALVFNSGYDANVGFFSAVPQRGDLVFYDELIHASIRDGIKMGNARSYKFKHNNINDLLGLIERSLDIGQDAEVYVVTESVFSMDGDSPDLKALAKSCSEKGYNLVVDEAHATGIFGDGKDLIFELGLQDKVFARILTFGKAMGCHGAAILGSEPLKSYLINFARSFIYTTALAPHAVATIIVAYKYLQEHGRNNRLALQQNISHFKAEVEHLGLNRRFRASDSAIHCLMVPGNQEAKKLSKELYQEGFDVKPILSPTIKTGEERLRFCLHAFNTKEEFSRVLHLIKNGMK